MKDPFPRAASRLIGVLLAALIAFLFFYRADELPRPHGDERAFLDVPYVPLGKIRQPTAYRKGLVGMLSGPPQFTNIRRA